VIVHFGKETGMRLLNDPQKLAEGKRWLKELRKAVCHQFRTYTDYVREAAAQGHYTYSELGATEEEILELAIDHAGEAAKSGYPHDMAIKSWLQCELQRVRGAHKLPVYAKLHVVSKTELPEAA
jgi:hypothetical protein